MYSFHLLCWLCPYAKMCFFFLSLLIHCLQMLLELVTLLILTASHSNVIFFSPLWEKYKKIKMQIRKLVNLYSNSFQDLFRFYWSHSLCCCPHFYQFIIYHLLLLWRLAYWVDPINKFVTLFICFFLLVCTVRKKNKMPTSISI